MNDPVPTIEDLKLIGNQCFTLDGQHYDVLLTLYRAEDLGIPVTDILISQLAHEFDGTEKSDEPDGSPEFVKRALATKPFPILVLEDRVGILHVVDGRHRLWKERAAGNSTIRGRILPVADVPEAAKVGDRKTA